jgi:catechol 2,3-dioxygenase-like lactoylglutathione lyase family enzyme
MSRIRYLAMLCAEPAGLAGFYGRSFGMEEIGRNDAGDVTLTDGAFNLTLFKQRPQLHEPRMEIGLHHLGVAVDNVEQTLARYRAFNPRGVVIAESGDLQHGEVRIHDPECHPVSLSQRNFGLSGSRPGIPRIAHIALNALDTERVLEFYRQVFGFRELFEAHRESMKRPGYRNKHVGDGHSNVAIQTFYSDEVGHEARFGIAHFGVLVGDSKAMAEQVEPEGNGCDLSQRGWEVDTDKWVRAGAA